MAFIEKWKEGYRVRWRDSGGCRSKTAPNLETAKKLKRLIEEAGAQGLRWDPGAVRSGVDLEDVLKDYLEECARIFRPATVRRKACCLDLFLRWLRATNRKMSPATLSKSLLKEFWEHLIVTGRHGRSRKKQSAQKILTTVELCWLWAYYQDDYENGIPQPKRLPIAKEPRTPTIAPTWEEMDRCIGACSGWRRQLAILARFTGLRVQQAMYLKWEDFNLDAATLTVRGELGKSKQERCGRIVPVSRHLIEALKEMATIRERKGFIVGCTRKADGPRAREARSRDMARAWERAGVRAEAWKWRPHHAFRKGVRSGLKRLGADDMAVEFLLGHALGIAGVYTDPDAMPLREAVELIPPLMAVGNAVDRRTLHLVPG